jgi:hypothetical protein
MASAPVLPWGVPPGAAPLADEEEEEQQPQAAEALGLTVGSSRIEVGSGDFAPLHTRQRTTAASTACDGPRIACAPQPAIERADCL